MRALPSRYMPPKAGEIVATSSNISSMSLTGLTLGLEFVAYAGIAVLMIVIVTSSRVSTRIVLGLSFKNFFPRKRLTRGRFRFKSSGHRRDAPITGMVSVFPFYDGQPPFVPTVAVCLAKAYIKPGDGFVILTASTLETL